MSKCRVFKFEINKITDEELNTLYNSKYEYLLVCKKPDNTLSGIIHFSIQKSFNIVFNMFFKKASLEVSQKRDKDCREELINKYEILFESGKIPKSKNNSQDTLEQTTRLVNILIEDKNKTKMIISQQSVQIQELLKLKDNETEQLKQITELCLAIAKNNPSVTNSNSNNKIKNNFNINIFLNEHCNKAVNLIDFVKGIQIELQDLLLYNKLGHAAAISKIIDNAYKKLDLTMRPIHCTDLKRETLYVRNMNEWLNDESKEISGKAMEIVSNTSIREMKQWTEANPNYEAKQDKKTEYMRLMRNVIGSTTNAEENAEKKKFIRNVSQNTVLDKDQAVNIMNH
jgi:hypothetical protein